MGASHITGAKKGRLLAVTALVPRRGTNSGHGDLRKLGQAEEKGNGWLQKEGMKAGLNGSLGIF